MFVQCRHTTCYFGDQISGHYFQLDSITFFNGPILLNPLYCTRANRAFTATSKPLRFLSLPRLSHKFLWPILTGSHIQHASNYLSRLKQRIMGDSCGISSLVVIFVCWCQRTFEGQGAIHDQQGFDISCHYIVIVTP
ncbi:hypothetical protein KCU99_g422, partial [Aureobasidium melanogenum]